VKLPQRHQTKRGGQRGERGRIRWAGASIKKEKTMAQIPLRPSREHQMRARHGWKKNVRGGGGGGWWVGVGGRRVTNDRRIPKGAQTPPPPPPPPNTPPHPPRIGRRLLDDPTMNVGKNERSRGRWFRIMGVAGKRKRLMERNGSSLKIVWGLCAVPAANILAKFRPHRGPGSRGGQKRQHRGTTQVSGPRTKPSRSKRIRGKAGVNVDLLAKQGGKRELTHVAL